MPIVNVPALLTESIKSVAIGTGVVVPIGLFVGVRVNVEVKVGVGPIGVGVRVAEVGVVAGTRPRFTMTVRVAVLFAPFVSPGLFERQLPHLSILE